MQQPVAFANDLQGPGEERHEEGAEDDLTAWAMGLEREKTLTFPTLVDHPTNRK